MKSIKIHSFLAGWALLALAGGNAGAQTQIAQRTQAKSGDCRVVRTSATRLTVNGAATPSDPCNAKVGGKITTFSSSATIDITAGAGAVLIYLNYSSGVAKLEVAYNGPTINCVGMSCVTVNSPSYPAGGKYIALHEWLATVPGAWDAGNGTPRRAALNDFAVNGGSGIAVTTASDGTQNVAVDTTVVRTLTSSNSSVTIGGAGSDPTLDVSTSYLNTLYPQLTAGNIFGAGFKQVFTPNATTAGARSVCGTLPSAAAGGDYGCTPAGIWWHSDGSAIQYHVTNANLSSISGYVPQWSGTSGTRLGAGLPVSATAAPGTVVESDGGGHIAAAWLPVANTRQVCSIIVGSDNGPVLANADLGPQRRRCYLPLAATVVEVMVAGDGGTPNLIAGRNHAGTTANLTSSSLAAASGGGPACSNTGGTTGIDGATTCSGTLQNTAIAPGDWIELVSGAAGGVAKRVSVAITYTIN